MWAGLTILVGLLLWAQLFSLAFVDEFRFREPSIWVGLSYLLPLAALVVGAVYRRPSIELMVFPVCFLPGLLWLPARSAADLQHGWSLVRIGVTVAAYMAVAAVGSSGAQDTGRADITVEPVGQRVDGIYPYYFVIRAAILAALLWVCQYAAFGDRTIAANIARHYSDRPEAAVGFLALFSFFAWCVAAYTMFLVPLMNLEYDVRKLSGGVDELVGRRVQPRWIRIGSWFLVAATALIAAWMFS